MKIQISLGIFFISLVVLFYSIGQPSRQVFDEKFYVPAAHAISDHLRDENFQHPPLAKEIVAISIGILGDGPLSWRAPSAVIGALTLVSIYFFGLLLFSNSLYALSAVLLVFTNGLFFTLSRLALLEIYSVGFATIAFVLLMYALYDPLLKAYAKWFLIGSSGLFFGLALASKWSAIVPLIVCLGGGVLVNRITLKQWMLFLFLIVSVYVVPFFVLDQVSNIDDFFRAQIAMWNFHNPDIYHTNLDMTITSQWWDWPFRVQPMWFAVLPNALHEPQKFLSVMIFGNPFVVWLGWLAVIACVWIVLSRKETQASYCAWVVAMILAPLLVWVLAQRPVTYYYYFLPTSVFLPIGLIISITLAVRNNYLSSRFAERFLIFIVSVSTIYFFYHWPLMVAQEMSAATFSRWYPHLRF